MVSIYCIQDCDGLKYVGSTKKKLNIRLCLHKSDKKSNYNYCSSEKLNLDKCEIYLLETCNESNRKQREKFWINEFDTVNERKLHFDNKGYHKDYWNENKDEINLFRRRSFVKSCYQFIKMLEQY
jgi:hypothetical protein